MSRVFCLVCLLGIHYMFLACHYCCCFPSFPICSSGVLESQPPPLAGGRTVTGHTQVYVSRCLPACLLVLLVCKKGRRECEQKQYGTFIRDMRAVEETESSMNELGRFAKARPVKQTINQSRSYLCWIPVSTIRRLISMCAIVEGDTYLPTYLG